MVFLVIILLKLLSCSAWSTDIFSQEAFFNSREEFYTETLDFSGSFPELKSIDIDARRKKRVALNLVGSYPVLKKIQYEGTFGCLTGTLTGVFPLLESMEYFCTACAINLDLTGTWEKSCQIIVKNRGEPIILKFPQNVGVIVKTKTTIKGKIKTIGLEKKKGYLKTKIFTNSLFLDSPIILNVEIETINGGDITLIG